MKHNLCLPENLKLPPNLQCQRRLPVIQRIPGLQDTSLLLEAESLLKTVTMSQRVATWPFIKYPWVFLQLLGKCPGYDCCFSAFHHSPPKPSQVVLCCVPIAFLMPILLAAVPLQLTTHSCLMFCIVGYFGKCPASSNSGLVRIIFMLVKQMQRKKPHYWWQSCHWMSTMADRPCVFLQEF